MADDISQASDKGSPGVSAFHTMGGSGSLMLSLVNQSRPRAVKKQTLYSESNISILDSSFHVRSVLFVYRLKVR